MIQSELEIALISGLFPSFPNEIGLGYNHPVLVTRIRISLLSLLLVHNAQCYQCTGITKVTIPFEVGQLSIAASQLSDLCM